MTYIPLENLSINKIIDNGNRSAENTLFGEAVTVIRRQQVSTQFHYNLSPDEIIENKTNSGLISCDNSQLHIRTGTTTNSSAKVTSVDNIAYESGHEIYCLFTSEFSTPVTGTTQIIGPYDQYNGFYIGFDGLDFVAARICNSTHYKITQSNFNLDKLDGTGKSGFDLNHQYNNLYKITFGWLGIAPITFWIYGGFSKGWIPFHVIDLVNSQTGPTIFVPILPITCEVNNGATTSNLSIKVGCWVGGILSSSQVSPPELRTFSQDSLKTINSNTNTNILTIKNKTTYLTKPNKINVNIKSIGFTTESQGSSTKPVKFYIYKDATITGTANFIDVHTDSVCQYDTSASNYAPTTGKLLLTFGAGYNGGGLYEFYHPLSIQPGSTLSVCALSASSNTIGLSLNWDEDF